MKKSRQGLLILPGLTISLWTAGCSVFSPITQPISQGHENFVSYFNAYYNAKRAFNDAEDEIRSAMLAARGRNPATPFLIPASAKQKLGIVIDKCSNILSFHPTSSLVDDALFLIGKSYFYEAEYLKAERKFSELIAQYPNSSLALEAHLWYTKTEERLGKLDDAIKSAEALVQDASDKGENDIAGEAYFILGSLYSAKGNTAKAIQEDLKAAEVSGDDDERATAQARVGDLYSSIQQYDNSAQAYLKVTEFSSDPYIIYYARLHAAMAFRQTKKFDEGLQITDDMISDYRFKDYAGSIRLERANILDMAGRREEALLEYRFIDTTYARTDIGAKASFELGRVYEHEEGDYAMARRFYERAAIPGSEVFQDATRKSNALAKYQTLRENIHRNDSLLVVALNPPPPRIEVARDTSAAGRARRDSTRSAERLSPDSINARLAEAAYELGEIFYSEVELPDSAILWYEQSLALSSDSMRAPRIYFVLAELSHSHPDKHYGDLDTYYRNIARKYPSSPYADQARALLGMANPRKSADPAEQSFRRAEALMDSSKYQGALDTLSSISSKYPNSPYAAKSEYTIGWLYENRMAKPDSALSYYKKVVERYASSLFAKAVSARVAGAIEKPDTTNTSTAPGQVPKPADGKNAPATQPPGQQVPAKPPKKQID